MTLFFDIIFFDNVTHPLSILGFFGKNAFKSRKNLPFLVYLSVQSFHIWRKILIFGNILRRNLKQKKTVP